LRVSTSAADTATLPAGPSAAPAEPEPPVSAGPSAGRVAWRALWTSRVVVMIAGVLGVVQIGEAPGAAQSYDLNGLTRPFGYFGNLLVSPLARWDSAWYLAIARDGYGFGGQAARTTFFPLYPLMIRAVGFVIRSDLIAGVLISLACFWIGLTVLHKLAALELGTERARICVLLVAFFPMSFFFSAVYTESLFLALSVGCIYQARLGRWAWAGVLGALAAASRNSGFVLIVPIVLLFLYGPRADRQSPPKPSRTILARLRPVHPLAPQLLWVLLVPAGLGAYLLFLALSTGHGLTPFSAETLWSHHFAGPFGGVWDGIVAAWDGLRQLVHGSQTPAYFQAAGGGFGEAAQNLMLFGFLVLGAIALAGALRRLPFAYAAYALAATAPALSEPVTFEPLRSLPRYEAVVFPLFMWAATWVHRRRNEPYVLACSAVLLGLFTVEFATWRFVA
jgi:Mannosyltransferase (PIG-V)